ncbi:ankyrin repeat-containing protein At5g02620-like [Eucalyptus grandis]|uniref:ankyrin repeat-containing protein At5g02620-like n=1 Tax=Eucalyptus grandis TaxID=71139 RepID=UPI00192E8A5F|nr:ankyrin repeat-containing protein At5g02620-like [Eucalyptus grandis]
MTDSRDGIVFHLAAFLNIGPVFKLLGPETEYLAREQDMNGHLPIHIASKRGCVDLIEKLLPISAPYNRYDAGNTPLHLAAKYSQPAALIPLMLDKRINPTCVDHKSLTAFTIARNLSIREPTSRKPGVNVENFDHWPSSTIDKTAAVGRDLCVLRPEARDEAFSYTWRKSKFNINDLKYVVNAHLLVATLVATVTFVAGFAVPGEFNGSDAALKDDQGMATMLDKRLL